MRPLLLCGGFLLFAGLLGCSGSSPYSSSVNTVSGRVLTPSGEPVRGGAEVVLTPKATDKGIFGTDGSGVVGPDGSFTIKTASGQEGVPGGLYTVVVRPHGNAKSTEKQAAMKAIPKKYWSEDTTDLTAEINGTKTEWEIKLQK